MGLKIGSFIFVKDKHMEEQTRSGQSDASSIRPTQVQTNNLGNYLGPLRSLKRGKKRMTTQSRLQSRQQRKTLFAQGRQIATNTAKSLCARQSAEAARHLLLHFDHAQIALGQ